MEIKSKYFAFGKIMMSVNADQSEIDSAMVKVTRFLSDCADSPGCSIDLVNIETVLASYGEQCGIRIFYRKSPAVIVPGDNQLGEYTDAHQIHPGPIKPEDLDFARNVAKRLDEHRELVMDLIEHTDFLADREATPWRAGRLATQDDYLMYLFFLRYGMWPDATNAVPARHCRPRPEILGTCGHPLYSR